MGSKSKNLRSGYTTGACAAAAAKAATVLLLRYGLCVMGNCSGKIESHITHHISPITAVDIPFPDGSRYSFSIHTSGFNEKTSTAFASVIKDAGDDPDITNGAEISATACFNRQASAQGIVIRGGKGVGTVTRPGLSIPVGEAAINPVPRKMIGEAVSEALKETNDKTPCIQIIISVPNGDALAKKTLNSRLGIVNGISILGTTGIVRPLSTEAWTATISATMDVAKAMGHQEIVLSTGRTSEKTHMQTYSLPEEMYVMMGDYLEYALKEARTHDFRRVHLSAQWAKMLKIAMSTPQTHVRHGVIDLQKVILFLNKSGLNAQQTSFPKTGFNTAREILDFIGSQPTRQKKNILEQVCAGAKRFAESITLGIPVTTHLISYDEEVIAQSG